MVNRPTANSKHILVVDDEPLVRRSLSELLTLAGYPVSSAGNGKEALALIKDYHVDIVITDIKMPQMDGVELLRQIKAQSPDTQVILITGFGSIDRAVEAMRQGAYDYITKPIVDSEIKIIIERLLAQRQLTEENKKLKNELALSRRNFFFDIVGQDEKMQRIYSLIEAVANTRATVIIHGESGTGKRLIALAIHKCNNVQRDKPFVEVSCGALSETLLESELFGHAKGSFTGAIKDRVGRFELAHGGTIFLDEIDAFSPPLQVKLLRVLQEGEFERVGDTKTIKVDVRVIAATNQNLEQLIKEGKFRTDLFYRLNIIDIEVPPLRERTSDIGLLVETFIQEHSKRLGRKTEGISEEAASLLMNYHWPGNVRELENVIERAIILSRGPLITPDDFPDFLKDIKTGKKPAVQNNGTLKDSLMVPERDLIRGALESTRWNRNETARVLGINRTTLYKKMLKYGLLKDRNGRRAQ